MKYENLIYEKIGKKAVITLNRPNQLNALNDALKLELADALDVAGDDPEVRVIVLTGAGDRAFCAGQELSETMTIDAARARSEGYKWIEHFKNLYLAFRRQDKVIIAMINGAACGSGLQISLLCDFRVAAKTARLGMTEITVGFPTITGSNLLRKVAGPTIALDMSFTGRLLNGEESKEWGLVSRVYDLKDLREETFKLADELAEMAPIATATMKQYFRQLDGPSFHESYDYAVIAHQAGYASGEPQKYQKKFFEERSKKS